MNFNVGSTRRDPEPLVSTIEDLRTCNTHEILIPTYVLDGFRDDSQNDARRAVEPTDIAFALRNDIWLEKCHLKCS